jgi:large subunit ribosomal protein L10
MKLADLESREVLLAKLAGAMKGSLAKAARTFDALRIKLEAGAPAPVAAAVVATPAVSEPEKNIAESEVPAEAVNSEDVAVTPATDETPAE